MASDDARKSDRVSIELSLQVSGTDMVGKAFLNDARTVVITRRGAKIRLARSLVPEQEVTICCVETGRETVARIVGQVGGGPGGTDYGISLIDPLENPWGIDFSLAAEEDEAVGRVLLECIHCHTREVAHLDAAELEVLETNQSLSRQCKHCTDASMWKRSFSEGLSADLTSPKPFPSAPVSPKEKRREVRRPLRVKACVQSQENGEDVVMTRNVSRGGFCFESQNLYGKECGIEIAVPYDLRGGNIFMSGRIARVQHVSETLKVYGAAYIRGAR